MTEKLTLSATETDLRPEDKGTQARDFRPMSLNLSDFELFGPSALPPFRSSRPC